MLRGKRRRQIEIRRGDAPIGCDEAEHRHVRDIVGKLFQIVAHRRIAGDLCPIEIAEPLGDAIEHQLVGLEHLERVLVDGVGGARQLGLRILEAPLIIEPGGAGIERQRQHDDRRQQELERPQRVGSALHRRSLHQRPGMLCR